MKVEKEKKHVELYTSRYIIRGNVHIPVNARLTDALQALSRQSGFLPMTDAVVKFQNGEVKDEKFLLIKISEIEMICSKDER
ncbi:MAG: hypothetical protein ABIN61_07345 [candidate division WOR-3 bacterium]